MDQVVVLVDSDSSFHVRTAEWETEAPSRLELVRQLRRARSEAPERVQRLLVQAHEEALHDSVVAALDAGRRAGMSDIRLQTIEDGD